MAEKKTNSKKGELKKSGNGHVPVWRGGGFDNAFLERGGRRLLHSRPQHPGKGDGECIRKEKGREVFSSSGGGKLAIFSTHLRGR